MTQGMIECAVQNQFQNRNCEQRGNTRDRIVDAGSVR